MNRGFFLTLEGVDGCGKTTQLNLLKEYFERTGASVVMAKEPGDLVGTNGTARYVGSDIGHQIRHMLFTDPTTHKMAPGVADLLFMADHVQLQHHVIAPALAADKVVLCDRYADSELAYLEGREVPPWALTAFNQSTSIWPHLTILLVGDCHLLAPRTKRGGHEQGKQAGKIWAGVEHQVRIQNAYLRNLQDLDRTIVIPVTEELPGGLSDLLTPKMLSIEEVHVQIRSEVVPRYLRHINLPTGTEQLGLFAVGAGSSSEE